MIDKEEFLAKEIGIVIAKPQGLEYASCKFYIDGQVENPLELDNETLKGLLCILEPVGQGLLELLEDGENLMNEVNDIMNGKK